MMLHPTTAPGNQAFQAPWLFSTRSALIAILMVCCVQLVPNLSMASEKERLVILPFEIVDNIPGPGSEERNELMLKNLTTFIGKKIKEHELFEVVTQNRVNVLVSAAQLGTEIHNCNLCEFDLARQAGGDKVMIGWIYKMSLLILTLHIEIKDVSGEQTIIRKAYDFRGDNEHAWSRAAKYMVRDLKSMLAY
ncbi:MAG: DUF3280 domain-containing protein [Candidatus Thiodiazotropha sp. (ex Rostrolucina anterorostrata)]|nr:DUF3280 domain-containing protein [Candidatus Thiodiazotropha sp. (ex Rostrolucina anterorostrata)]